jgi:ectoine hydroxylase-related dioxygenase (phytanoyl-CoA dioxygenase family)
MNTSIRLTEESVTALNNSFDLSDEERGLLPTDEDVSFYAEHGWYLSGKLFSDDEIEKLHGASVRYYGGHRDRLVPVHPPKIAYWPPEKGETLRHNDYVHYEDEEMGAILTKPLLGAVAAMLTQCDEMRMFQSTLIYKPPVDDEPSNIVPWHYDKDYWATSTSEQMLTAFIPFHDCDKRIGTICMIDGSHLWKEADQTNITGLGFPARDPIKLDAILLENARFNGSEIKKVVVDIPVGHVSFHHCRTYHGSGPNHSELPRRAISVHMQDGDNRYREFRLPNGELASYNHDFLVRKTAQGQPDYADPEFCPVMWRFAPKGM